MKKTMKLMDRIMLVNLLQDKWTFEELIVCDDIKTKIWVSQDEVVKFEIKTIEGNITWNEEWTKSKYVYEFSDIENWKIVSLLMKISEKKEASKEMLWLYKTFCL